MTDKFTELMVSVALSMYLGETCPYCLKKFEKLADLDGAVYNGYTEYGRVAHKECFFKAHPEMEEVKG